MKVCSCSHFGWCKYFHGLWVSFVMADEFSVRVAKIYFKDWCLMNLQLTTYIPVFDLFLTYEMVILSKGHKTDNFESRKSLNI